MRLRLEDFDFNSSTTIRWAAGIMEKTFMFPRKRTVLSLIGCLNPSSSPIHFYGKIILRKKKSFHQAFVVNSTFLSYNLLHCCMASQS